MITLIQTVNTYLILPGSLPWKFHIGTKIRGKNLI